LLCLKCANKEQCVSGNDCVSGNCNESVCVEPVVAETCFDEIKNQDETGVDCGGSCSGCVEGFSCLVDSDCLSLNCVSGVCQPVTQTCFELSGIICRSTENCTGSILSSRNGDCCVGGVCEQVVVTCTGLGGVVCDVNETCSGAIQPSSGGDCCVGGACAGCVDEDSDDFFAQQNCGTIVDCDDTNPDKSPGLIEVCDGIDNNCDGEVDENGVCGACTNGQTQNCPLQLGVCQGAQQVCSESEWPGCNNSTYLNHNSSYEEGTEVICDGIDNDCDGEVDEGCIGGFLSPMTRIFKPSSLTIGSPTNMATIDNFEDHYIVPDIVMFKNEGESIQLALNTIPNEVSLDYDILFNNTPTNDLEVELYHVNFAYTTRLFYPDPLDLSPKGFYSDPLVPYSRNEILNPDEKPIWWLTIRSSNTTNPGNYTILLNLTQDGQIFRKSFNVTVLSPSIPRRANFKMILNLKFGVGENGFKPFDYHNASTISEKEQMIENYMQYLNKNRINHVFPYFDPSCENCFYLHACLPSYPVPITNLTETSIDIDFTSFDIFMEKYFDNGNMNSFGIYASSWGFFRLYLPPIWGTLCDSSGYITQSSDPEEYDRIHRLFWTKIISHLEEKGWLEYSFIYIDEPFGSSRTGSYIIWDNNFTKIIRSIHPQYPKIYNLLGDNTVNFIDLIQNQSNIDSYNPIDRTGLTTIPNPLEVLEPTIENLLTENQEKGTYWISTAHDHADRPILDNRLWGYKYWKYNIKSLYHWNVLRFASNVELGVTNPWTLINNRWGAGGAIWFYPPCKTGQCTSFNPTITPSIRTEMYREGLEDYDYLVMLSSLIQQAKTQGQNTTDAENTLNRVNEIITDLDTWSRDIILVDEIRREIIYEIEALS